MFTPERGGADEVTRNGEPASVQRVGYKALRLKAFFPTHPLAEVHIGPIAVSFL
jgi:hypothetical protein